jgi:hypothetical protein
MEANIQAIGEASRRVREHAEQNAHPAMSSCALSAKEAGPWT